jgi:serine/threonine-protein kinase
MWALHAAHEAVDERGTPLNIVHRDVSPQNIMVGVDGVSRVLDFGIAKAASRFQSTRHHSRLQCHGNPRKCAFGLRLHAVSGSM